MKQSAVQQHVPAHWANGCCLLPATLLQGRIASFMCGDEPLGPPRVWLREVNIPGLCMTRSFGDYVAASVGVIDQPQLMAATLKPEDK